jgi:hypothetical protein
MLGGIPELPRILEPARNWPQLVHCFKIKFFQPLVPIPSVLDRWTFRAPSCVLDSVELHRYPK